MSDTLFLDLDGTLLRNDKTLSAFTVATLGALRAAGHRLVFATARPVRAARRLLPEAFHREGLICGNGARGLSAGTFLWDETLDPKLMAEFTARLAVVPGVVIGIEALDALTVSGLPWEHSAGDVFAVDPALAGRVVAANKVLVAGDSGALDRAEALLPTEVSRVRTDAGTLLQIMPPGIDKGVGVARFLAAQGRGPGGTLGFGDDLNDVPLMRSVDLGVAPANALAEVRALASVVLSGGNDDDAVAAFLADRYLGGDQAAIEYRVLDRLTPEFVALTEDLDRELHRKKGLAQQAYQGLNRLDGIADVVLAVQGGRPQGCASFKVRGPGVAEVKRVYVRPERRGRGVSRHLMEALETRARERGIGTLLVETSRTFVEANGLYPALGYRVVDNYPPYEGMADSICFCKETT